MRVAELEKTDLGVVITFRENGVTDYVMKRDEDEAIEYLREEGILKGE